MNAPAMLQCEVKPRYVGNCTVTFTGSWSDHANDAMMFINEARGIIEALAQGKFDDTDAREMALWGASHLLMIAHAQVEAQFPRSTGGA